MKLVILKNFFDIVNGRSLPYDFKKFNNSIYNKIVIDD